MSGPTNPDEQELMIHTQDQFLTGEIFPDTQAGSSVDVGGLTLENNGLYIQKDGVSTEVLTILIDIGGEVSKAVVVNFLYDKLKNKEVSIETAKGKYKNSKEGIEKALEDIIED